MKNNWLTKSIIGILSYRHIFLISFIPGFLSVACFVYLAGIYIALVDSMERALAGDLLPSHLRGTGYGVLSMVNGIGDFISSFVVGLLWAKVSPSIGLIYACSLTLLGCVVLFLVRDRNERAIVNYAE